MSALRFATALNVRAFQILRNTLGTSDGKWSDSLDHEALEDEIGRFRVWSGNLGALQKGHSSLDYRLRDSPLLSSNALKFLKELEEHLNEAYAIVSGARLPFEDQNSIWQVAEDDNEDGFFSEDDDDEEEELGTPTNELKMRFEEIVDIIDNLYRLSVRIRTPTIRSKSLRAASYRPLDAESGADILSAYAKYDLQHVKELLSHLRESHPENLQNEQDFLAVRLSAAITLRRRYFKYWKRHRDKLGASTVLEEALQPVQPPGEQTEPVPHNNDAEPQSANLLITAPENTPSQRTGHTLLSGTEATHYHQSLDEIVDTKSVTSYAVTVKDLHGRGVDLPNPPKTAHSDRDFECPYCYIICPARYGRGRAWRTHLLQDLQPYICTYADCTSSEQLFRSRREWVEHEASHRKAWRCPEHPTAVYKSPAGLEGHLRQNHLDSFPGSQLATIVKVSETTTIDMRTNCPICYASADTEGLGDLHNHIANHLERIATFALPHSTDDDSDGASSVASRGMSGSSPSQQMSDMSLPSDTTTEQDTQEEVSSDAQRRVQPSDLIQNVKPSHNLLSAASLNQLPDTSQNRLDMIASQLSDMHNTEDQRSEDQQLNALPSNHQFTTDTQGKEDTGDLPPELVPHEEQGDSSGKQAIITAAEIPTLSSLYSSKQLLQRDQSYAPNDNYNRMVSFRYHDLTRLRVDAIVNSVNTARFEGADALNHTVHEAGGPDLAKETDSRVTIKFGQVELTRGHALPCSWVIHAATPSYSGSKGVEQFNMLIECYRNALRIAGDYDMKTIAFPCLGAGGCGFPPRVAARTALQEVRKYLDAHVNHRFERIIFCANSAVVEKAYMDFFPTFFPPTHGDLDRARTSDWPASRAALAAQCLETRAQVQNVLEELLVDGFSHLRVVDTSLASIRSFLLGSRELKRSLGDLNLLCSVVLTVCNSMKEAFELVSDTNASGETHRQWWKVYNSNTKATHGMDLLQLLKYLGDFSTYLDAVLTQEGTEPDQMSGIRQSLENYGVRQKGQDTEGIRDHLDEVLYTREFQQETSSSTPDIVKLQHIPSVAQLYQLGELEAKTTLAEHSTSLNQAVCLIKEDITKLEVDVVVNSTDASFLGMGTLDHSIFEKGGSELREEVGKFGKCKKGDSKLTAGYLLPAKHILHVIPPQQYRKDAKETLRSIYREILHTATRMKAKSVAIPSIGTGMLNYPRRECVSLALDEVREFLRSPDRNDVLGKIVFVVYSSNDEFIYKSLLPSYFPPPDPTDAHPIMKPDGPTSSSSVLTAGSSLFGSFGKALRSGRFGKRSETSRPVNSYEEHALIEFESHAKDCDICKKTVARYLRECSPGYTLGQTLLWYMSMSKEGVVYAKADKTGKCDELEVPGDMFPLSLEMLRKVEENLREEDQRKPLVSQEPRHAAVVKDQVHETRPLALAADVTGSTREPPGNIHAKVDLWSPLRECWEPIDPGECNILVYQQKMGIHRSDVPADGALPLLALKFTATSTLSKTKQESGSGVVLSGGRRLESEVQHDGPILIGTRDEEQSVALVSMLQRAINRSKLGGATSEERPGANEEIDKDPYNEPPLFNPELEWTPQFDIYSEDIWNYVTFPLHPLGERWTRIDKRIVDSVVLDGFVFEVLEHYFLVQEELSMERIHDLVQMTRARRMRRGKTPEVDASDLTTAQPSGSSTEEHYKR